MKLDDLLIALVGGVIIGCAARVLWPSLALWAGILLATAGMIGGTVIYLDILRFAAETPNIDWWRHIWQIGTGIALVSVVAALTGRLPYPR